VAKLKPTLASHSSPCCGECVYCHKDRGGAIVCFVNPPVYAYGDEENAVFVRPRRRVPRRMGFFYTAPCFTWWKTVSLIAWA